MIIFLIVKEFELLQKYKSK